MQRWTVALIIRPPDGEEFAILFDPDKAAEAASKLDAEVAIVRSSEPN